MAFLRSLFGAPNTKPDFTGLQIQTATATLPIPIIWGMTKLGANVVWYNNFQTTNPSGGKGGVFNTSSSSSYAYTADLIMALCEGPLQGINQIWKDQDIYSLSGLNLTLFEGTTPQTTWGYLSSIYPNEALAYQGTAYVCAASYQLGDNASIGNHNFEVVSADFYGTSPNGIDADPATVIYDFLTSAQYGAGFAATSINTATLYGGGAGSTDASLQAYCAALGIGFSPALTGQETASSILTRWLQICNCGAVWSGTQLKFIPYGDVAIGTANLTQTIKFSVPQPSTDPNEVINPAVTVCSASLWVSDGGVKYAFTGVALSYSGGAAASGQGSYGLTSSWLGQQYVFAPADEGTVVALTFTRAVPRGYAPDLTPVYSLTDTDFIASKPGEEPIRVSRLDPFTLPNVLRIECRSRANQYGSTPVEARDQSQIELYGPRVGSSVTADEICDDILVAPIVAQTLLQRGLYVRAHFKFGLSWEFCLLEPMDIVEISDANLGLTNYPVRITEIDEDENGVLAVTAEELTVGISTPVQYPSASPMGWQSNHGVQAAAINPPLIYEPPPALTGNVAQIWLGASGGISGSADPYWGGAYIYASLDNTSYGSPIGQISSPLRQGVLTANLALATGWDTADTLSVNLAESGGVLDSGSAASAQAGAPLALVGQELVAYETATPGTPTGVYNLSGLERGLYTSTAAAHSIGDAFARLDAAVFKYSVPANLIGKTLYFKFQSYNVFGSGLQQLSTCVAYSHSLSGSGIAQPADITGFGANLVQGAPSSGNAYTLVAVWTPDPNSISYEVDMSTNSGASWVNIYAGSAPNFSDGGLGYIASLLLRVKGINGAFSSPSYTKITVYAPAQTMLPATNVGLYAALNDLQADLADIVAQAMAFAEDSLNIATLTHVMSLQGGITAAQSQIGGLGASTAMAMTTLTASIGSVSAALNSFEIAQATASSAVALDLTSLSTKVGSVSAGLSTFMTAQSTWSSAVALDVTSLSASVGSNTATISTTVAAVAVLNGITAASYGVSLDVNGYITGFQVLNGGAGVSAFTVRADEFDFIMPGYSSTRVMVVSPVNGVATLAFNGNLIADGTIKANTIVASTAVITSTLQLGTSPYNVVTIPTSWFSSATVQATGGYVTLETLTFTLDQPAFVHIVFAALQNYYSGFYDSSIAMNIDYSPACGYFYSFLTATVVLAYSPPAYLAAGAHTIEIVWWGSGTAYAVNISEMSLIVLGIKR